MAVACPAQGPRDSVRARKSDLPHLFRVLRLALLAPDPVEAILDGRHGGEVTLARLLDPFPVD